MTTKHTPTPWRVRELNTRIAADIVAESGRQIALMTEHHGDEPMTPMSQFVRSEQDKADAAHIVKCVNLHDELVSALESSTCTCIMKQDLDSYSDGKQLWQVDTECKRCKAIKRAKGRGLR